MSEGSTPTPSTSTFARARASRMFTGIITDVGTIDAIEQRGDLRVRVRAAYDMAGVDLGASIACSGVCLTVVDKDEGWFAVRSEEHTSELQSLTRISYAVFCMTK